MFARISVAAQLGSVETGPDIIDHSVKERMKQRFKEISSGSFAKKLNSLSPDDIKALKCKIKEMSSPELEKAVKEFNK
jgi:ketol-acid reductoisomerase